MNKFDPTDYPLTLRVEDLQRSYDYRKRPLMILLNKKAFLPYVWVEEFLFQGMLFLNGMELIFLITEKAIIKVILKVCLTRGEWITFRVAM